MEGSSSAQESKACSFKQGKEKEEVSERQLVNDSHVEADQKHLSSPTQLRSSLRSPEKIRSGLTKGGCRVVFSDSKILDSSSERDIIQKAGIYELGQEMSSAKRLNLNDTNAFDSCKLSSNTRLSSFDNFDHVCLTSTPQHKDFMKKLQNDKICMGHKDYSGKLAGEIKTSSGSAPTLHTEAGSNSTSPFKMSSDLHTSTYPYHNHFSTLSASFNDTTSKLHSLSAGVLPGNSQPVAMRPTMLSSVPGKVKEAAANRSSSSSRDEYKQNESLHSLVSPKHCFKDSRRESFSSELSNGPDVTESHSPTRPEKAPQVTAVLQQLLELVDCHWNGSGSLLFNKDFLVPAQNLLLHLVACTTSPHAVHLPAGHNSSTLGRNDSKVQRTQLKHTEQFDRTNTATQPVKGLEESQMSASKLQDMDQSAASNHHIRRNQAPTYDDLLWKNEQLSFQVEFLKLELKQLNRLQETVALLQDSQRSLLSTNNFLMQQLNKENSPAVHKTALPSERCTTRGKSPPLERTAPVPSAYSSEPCVPKLTLRYSRCQEGLEHPCYQCAGEAGGEGCCPANVVSNAVVRPRGEAVRARGSCRRSSTATAGSRGLLPGPAVAIQQLQVFLARAGSTRRALASELRLALLQQHRPRLPGLQQHLHFPFIVYPELP